jgi:quinol monooxygenase YgiN
MTYAVCVTFTIHADKMEAFLSLVKTNAQTSLADEVGCQQFDVLTDPSHPTEVFLYELYDSPDAFQLHLASAHFHTFDTAVSPMIADKVAKTYTQVTQ